MATFNEMAKKGTPSISKIKKLGIFVKNVRVSVGGGTETDGEIYKFDGDYFIIKDPTFLTPMTRRRLDLYDLIKYELA